MDIFEKLKAPFRVAELQWRPGLVDKANNRAQALPYIDARSVQDRLDEVVGPGNWTIKYSDVLSAGRLIAVRGHLSLRIDGEWITKEDASNFDAGNEFGVKAAHSEALKRAAVQWGIGRYLYAYRPVMVPLNEHGQLAKIPQLPKEFLCEEDLKALAAADNEQSEEDALNEPAPSEPTQQAEVPAEVMQEKSEPSVDAQTQDSPDIAFPAELSAEEAQSVKDFAQRMPGYPRSRLEAYLASDTARQRFSPPALAYLKKVLEKTKPQEAVTA